jgi:hypothetical protein
MALLERPFASYEKALEAGEIDGEVRPMAMAGAEGIVVSMGRQDGLDVTYQFVPIEGRTLLIKVQRDGETPPEDDAINQAIDSIDLGD